MHHRHLQPHLSRCTHTQALDLACDWHARNGTHANTQINLSLFCCLQHSVNPIRRDVGAVRTLKLLWGSLIELSWYLGRPGRWCWKAMMLFGFIVAMLPVFVPPFLHVLLSKRILKNITYGPSIRHQLDVYLPTEEAIKRCNGKCPVVIFVSGGAWIIGYKLWAFLMGCVLQERGIVFISPDYRNFPQGQVPDMVNDVSEAIKWAVSHVHHLGDARAHTRTHVHADTHTCNKYHSEKMNEM